MIYLAVVQSIVTLVAILVIVKVIQSAREERRELEDRLMAVCHPVAQLQVATEYKPGGVKYIDEEPYSPLLKDNNAPTKA